MMQLVYIAQHIHLGIIANNSIMQILIMSTNRKTHKKIVRVLLKFPPTHLCIAMRKTLKDLASEKRKFKLCKALFPPYQS